MLVPSSTVTGRSVFSLIVRQTPEGSSFPQELPVLGPMKNSLTARSKNRQKKMNYRKLLRAEIGNGKAGGARLPVVKKCDRNGAGS
jgi:hypothetical protein